MKLFERAPMPATHAAITAAFGLMAGGSKPIVEVERDTIRPVLEEAKGDVFA